MYIAQGIAAPGYGPDDDDGEAGEMGKMDAQRLMLHPSMPIDLIPIYVLNLGIEIATGGKAQSEGREGLNRLSGPGRRRYRPAEGCSGQGIGS